MKSIDVEKTLNHQKQFLNRFSSMAFDDQAADHYATIRAQLERIGQPIGGNDLLIAAIALANNLTLVIHNTSEFSRIPGLMIQDWEI